MRDSLKIIPPILDFAVIAFIGLKTLNTDCFSGRDLSLSLIVLIFSVIVELYYLIKNKRKNL